MDMIGDLEHRVQVAESVAVEATTQLTALKTTRHEVSTRAYASYLWMEDVDVAEGVSKEDGHIFV